jgi:hypothetical protein
MEMRAMRIRTPVFSALPVQGAAHNLAVKNNVFDSLIASLGALANLFD